MKLEDFESVFRSSVKERYEHKPLSLESALLVTDVDEETTKQYLETCKKFLRAEDISWSTMRAEEHSEGDVLNHVRRSEPSLVVCYRHVLGQGAKLPYSLGAIVDTLTQATDVPVLLVPRPDDEGIVLPDSANKVMVITDHLTGDHRLVNWAAHFCDDHGRLFLSHIEDEEILNKYLDVCSKIPGLDTAAEKIPSKLLSLPQDFIASIADILASNGIHETVTPIVQIGKPVKLYESLVEEHDIDLLVMNTKDDGQNAMHSLAYALSVEIRSRALLLL